MAQDGLMERMHMSSTFGGLNIAVRGLYSQQAALDTVGHNISNANADGYSRQTVNLTSTTPEIIYGSNGQMQKGTGSQILSITRARDTFVDKQMWKETATLGYAQSKQDTLAKIEGVFHEPSDTGIQNVLNNFWTAWQTLATNASDSGARTIVRERGVELANAIDHSATQLRDMVADANDVIDIKVNSVNQITSEIYSLNKQISNIEASKTSNANDLRDRRDVLVDQLSSLMKISVTEDAQGSYSIQTASATLVNSTGYMKLATVTTKDADYGYALKNVVDAATGQPFTLQSGEIQGLIESRDSTDFGIKAYMNNLSTISQFLLTDFNAAARVGYGTDNSTNNNFFGRADGMTETLQSTGKITTGTPYAVGVTLADQFGLTAGSDNSFQLSDGTNSFNVSVDLAANPTMTIDDLVAQINTGASAANVNVRAGYDSATDKFYLYNTSGSTTVSIANVGASDGINFTSNKLRLDVPPKSDWLSRLQVNSALFAVGGLDKIPAKAGLDGVTVQQTNPAGGVATVANNYTGSTAQQYIVKIDSITAGNVSGIRYSTDNGTTWSNTVTPVVPATIPPSFQIISGGTAGTLTIQIPSNTANQVNDQYSFSTNRGNAAGSNAISIANKLKIDASNTLGKTSLDTYYSSMIGALGVQSQDAQRLTENQKTLVSQIYTWRESTAGVNMDEEMTNMIRFQRGYNASARILTTMDEMLDKLINGTGVVGR